MKLNAKIHEDLQRALSMELAAVNQYLLHAVVAEDWGLDTLAAKMREELQEELAHAKAFASRILFLKGDPKPQAAKIPQRAQNLETMFEDDLRDEKEAVLFYTQAAKRAMEVDDIGTYNLFAKNALDEEGHMDWLETQLSLLNQLGEATYISLQISNSESGKYQTLSSSHV